MKTKHWIAIFLTQFALIGSGAAVIAKHTAQAENMAVIIGNAGESYPIFGTGGIVVTGGHHGMFQSNMKQSQIQIDGSGVASQKTAAIFANEDFPAAAGNAYFVSSACVCTLASAAGCAGQEITVINTSKNGTITYQTTNGEALVGIKQAGQLQVSNVYGQVDKFISDGKTWFRE